MKQFFLAPQSQWAGIQFMRLLNPVQEETSQRVAVVTLPMCPVPPVVMNKYYLYCSLKLSKEIIPTSGFSCVLPYST